MSDLVIWKKDDFSILYKNDKYSLRNSEKVLINQYDSITPCSDYFFIGCKKCDKSYKYQLFNINGDKLFGEDKLFRFISFDQSTNVFTFYDYFKKITLSLPRLSGDKNKLFVLFLSQLYSKKINDIGEYQKLIDDVSSKVDNWTEENVNEIIQNLDLINKLNLKLNKPDYLKDYLIVLDEESQNKLLEVISNNRYKIFRDLTKDFIKNPKIYELNLGLINNIMLKNRINSLNDILNTLDSIHDTFEKQMLNVYTSRYKIFSSLDNIREYFEDSMTIKYFDHDDFDYIKKDRNLFLNIMYNNSNKDILNFLKTYSLVD